MQGIFVICFLAIVTLSRGGIIQLSCGPVEGVETDYAFAYYAIPYAKPPVQHLRWQPSEPADCWVGTLNGTSPSSICFQVPTEEQPSLTQSEDCLYLDIYIPKNKNPSRVLPVVFWIYGGSNIIGYSSEYGGLDYLAQEMQVILVAPNYRLGTLGFLALKELSQRDHRGSSGNYGITDLVLALKWVQREIHHVGGDHHRVTLLGQSSGGTNIFALLASRESKHLFKNAISLSGSPNVSMSLSQAEQQHRDLLLPALGCQHERDLVRCLLEKDPKSLTLNLPMDFQESGGIPSNPKGMNFAGLVIADGVTVESFTDVVQTKDWHHDKGIIFQTTYGEIFPFFPNHTIASYNTAQIKGFLNNVFSIKNGWSPDVVPGLEKLYQHELTGPQAGYVTWSALTADIFFLGGNAVLGLYASESWKHCNIYVGTVTYAPSTPFCVLDPDFPSPISFHMWDYMLAANNFTMLKGPCSAHPFQASEADQQVGAAIRAQWKTLIYNGTLEQVNWKKTSMQDENIGVIGSPVVDNFSLNTWRQGVIMRLISKPYELNTPPFWFVN